MKQLIVIAVMFFGIAAANAQFLSTKKNLQKFQGFFDFHYSEEDGEIYLEVDKLDTEFLYVHSLSTGLGSNDIGLDRGQLGDGVIVKFVKSGNKILLIQQNMQYRGNTEDPLERKSIEQAFAKSVLFGFDIKKTKGKVPVIDLTPFLLLDAHGVAQNLKRNKEGTYKLDATRNSLWMENTKAFPKNLEFEAILTFVGEPEGKNLESVAPDANSVSVIQHHSFVELPKNNYKPRVFDPNCGSYPMSYMDYSTSIWEPITKRFITRHHLEKKDPLLSISEAKDPIIYYLDPGTPEPIRTALLEGAQWWNQAFEAIGYKDAFQVKLLPPDADPMDLRYNVIQWVHRSTRGWSYGSTINDPRTGEILKGHVSLGSLRIRQDFLIAQALMNKPFAERDDNYEPMLEMALARIRQLAAHEVGHTLGFTHNFAASTSNRSSVMDYPHPVLSLKNKEVDFSDAYAVGIGDWDKVTIAYSYSDLLEGVSEKQALKSILDDAFSKGMRFITDSDARASGGAHSKAHLWDNGENASEELKKNMAIRTQAIANFSEDNIRNGDPYSELEDVFAPLYFFHRYQTEAAVKLIGGLDYSYAVKGEQRGDFNSISNIDQMQAFLTVLETLDAINLAIPERLLQLFPPRAYGYPRTRESFQSKTGVPFDPIGAAATASDLTLSLLLHPERANRLVLQKSLDSGNLDLDQLLHILVVAVFNFDDHKGKRSEYLKEIERAIQFETLQHLFNLAVNPNSIPQTKAITNNVIDLLNRTFSNKSDMFSKQLVLEIKEFREHPEKFKIIEVPKIPDGSPIGSFQCGMNAN
jgi:hypothetical protein